jgi:hypothetical protein
MKIFSAWISWGLIKKSLASRGPNPGSEARHARPRNAKIFSFYSEERGEMGKNNGQKKEPAQKQPALFSNGAWDRNRTGTVLGTEGF